ncbi:ImmA/IrrE family metallo-endopeptidase [Oceanicaulis alexandrii]|uniref:ImmA/IrrE family metallo-endopeptidase n=1 Tax=Oceanicaulis alexandrii TaxID=153233 RepID=UPI0035D0B852
MIGPVSYWAQLKEDEKKVIQNALSEIPVKVGKLARDLGLEVKAASLRPGISGELRRSDSTKSGFIIRVNRHERKYRQRFTIAHEIAHYLLHRHHIGQNGIVDDLLYRSSLSDAREAQANRLAADLLMPNFQLKKALEDSLTSNKQQLVSDFATAFDVSEAAMRIKLQNRMS